MRFLRIINVFIFFKMSSSASISAAKRRRAANLQNNLFQKQNPSQQANSNQRSNFSKPYLPEKNNQKQSVNLKTIPINVNQKNNNQPTGIRGPVNVHPMMLLHQHNSRIYNLENSIKSIIKTSIAENLGKSKENNIELEVREKETDNVNNEISSYIDNISDERQELENFTALENNHEDKESNIKTTIEKIIEEQYDFSAFQENLELLHSSFLEIKNQVGDDFNSNFQDKIDSYDNGFSSINNELSNLRDKNSVLENKNLDLDKKITILNKNVQEIIKKNELLENSNKQLLEKINSLESKNDKKTLNNSDLGDLLEIDGSINGDVDETNVNNNEDETEGKEESNQNHKKKKGKK